MRKQLEKMPVTMEMPGSRVLSSGSWGGLVVEYFDCTDRVDLGPILEGLPGNMCQCPHWGHMVKGAFHVQYADGSEEEIRGGDLYYMPEGHTGWIEPNSAMILFSPEAEAKVVADHVAKKMEG